MRKALTGAFTNPQSREHHSHSFLLHQEDRTHIMFLPTACWESAFLCQHWTPQLFGIYILLMYLLNNGNSRIFRRQNFDLQSLFILKIESVPQFKQKEKKHK